MFRGETAAHEPWELGRGVVEGAEALRTIAGATGTGRKGQRRSNSRITQNRQPEPVTLEAAKFFNFTR